MGAVSTGSLLKGAGGWGRGFRETLAPVRLFPLLIFEEGNCQPVRTRVGSMQPRREIQ